MADHWMPLPRYALRKNLVLHLLKKYSHKSQHCLEIGYGSGDLLIALSKLGLNTYGYDFSIKAVNMAKRTIQKQTKQIKDKIRLLRDEAQINHRQYDFVIALEVLEHVEDDAGLLKSFATYLKKNGLLIISVPAHEAKWGENDIWAGHYRRYERNGLIEKLLLNNFEVLHIWSYGYPLILLLDILIHRNRKGDLDYLSGKSKDELTKRSGIKRENTLINQLASWEIWVFPFFYIQRLFLNFDWSSAFLVIARKKG